MELKSLILIPALAQIVTAAYVRHDNPAGFRVEHPEGWINAAQAHDRDPVTQCRFLRPHPRLRRPQAPGSRLGFTNIAGRISTAAKAVVNQVQQQESRPDVALARLTFAGVNGEAKGKALCTIAGGAGTLMVIAAHRAEFAAQSAVLGHIVQSFTFVTPLTTSHAGPTTDLRYVRFRDPREGAFSLEVAKLENAGRTISICAGRRSCGP